MRNLDNYIKNKENPFEKMDAEARYWIGYILADGHLVYNNRQYSISLFSKNEEIMRKFQEFIGDKARFYKRPTGICHVIYNSKVVTKWFMDTFNVPQKKALVLNPTLDLYWDILHGYFDGDGCVRLSGRRFEAKFTTGSKIWASRIQQFLFEEGIDSTITSKGNAYDVNIYNKGNLLLLYLNMYKSKTSKLEYKYNKLVALVGNS